MTRKFLMTTTTIATLIAAPVAYASSIAEELPTNSPQVAEDHDKTEAGSITRDSDIAVDKRYGVGNSEYDPTRMAMPESEYDALMASIGADFKTSDGMQIGNVAGIDFDAMGNPELAIDLREDTRFEAEKLILTLLPDSVQLSGDAIIIDTTFDDLLIAADTATARGEETVTVNIM